MNKIFHNKIIIYFIPIILPLSLLQASERIGVKISAYTGLNTPVEKTSCANSQKHIHNDLY
jgi:hypothetical protein